MTRKETTKALSEMVEKLINPHNDPRIYWAREVTFDYSTTHAVRVDYMKFKPINNTVSGIEKGDFYCYEVKSSVEDFNSKNGHNFIGDFNYYVMPYDVYVDVENKIPYNVGVYCPNSGELRSVKKAKRKDRDKPLSEMLLMMFRSVARDRKMTENAKGLEKAKEIEGVQDVDFPRYNHFVTINGILTGLNMSESEYKEFRETEMMK